MTLFNPIIGKNTPDPFLSQDEKDYPMRTKDSNIVKELKKLEKLVDKVTENINFSKVKKGSDLPEQARVILNAYDDIEEILFESIDKYEKIIANLNIQAIVDYE